MKEFSAEQIRNFALIGHGASGKTILSEAMLFNAGITTRMGTIEDGNTVSDYHPSEIERQISVHATPLFLEWMDTKFNFIDTPGTSDFIGESLGALGVVDFVLVTVHGVNGVEVGTEQMWRYANKQDIPKILVVTCLNKENTNFDQVLEQCRNQFGQKVFPLQLPVNSGPGFNQIVDVLRNEIVTYQTDGSGKFTESPAEGEWAERVAELHEQLIEYVAESDDS
ncbi:MAG: GTP-binding protein, partial [Candidatus Neomarinimicrobiota bacterium]